MGRIGPRFQRLREPPQFAGFEGEERPRLQPARAGQAARHLGRALREHDRALRLRLGDQRRRPGEKFRADRARQLRRGFLEQIGQLHLRADGRQRPDQEPQRARVPRYQAEHAPGKGRSLLAVAGSLVPRAGLEVVGRSLVGGMRFQRLAERDEPLAGGSRVPLRHQPRVQRDGRRVARIFRQRVGKKLLALERIRQQHGGAEFQMPALAGLDASFGPLPQELGQIG